MQHVPQTSSPARRVFVVGFDGATFDLIDPWVKAGLLPNLAALMQEGVFGTLASTIPPISAPAWTSFMTGVNPGKHGIYGFQTHVAGTYRARLMSGADCCSRTLWRILSDAGKHAISVNVAMTYPPEAVNGIIISGVDAPGSGSHFTHPPELAAELKQAIGEYVIEPGVVEHCRRRNYGAAFDAIMYATEQRFKAVEYLMERKPWDLFVVNYRATDNIQHHFWHLMDPTHPAHEPEYAGQFGDAIQKVYCHLDDWLGTLRARLGPETTLMVVSDHGAGPASAVSVYLNRWLAQEGYLTFAGSRDAGIAGRAKAALTAMKWKFVWGFLRKWLGKRTKDTLHRWFPGLFARVRTPAAYFSIDWSKTRAYSDEFREVVWINLKGREPQGTAEPGAEYEALRTEIAGRLLALTDPISGTRIVETVHRREEVYRGGQLEEAPDLILELCEKPYIYTRLSHTTDRTDPVQTLSSAQLRQDHLPPGLHRPLGILFMQGQDVHAGQKLQGAQIIDMAPTILHLLGMEVPRDMDGRVLKEALSSSEPVRYCGAGDESGAARGGYSDGEEETVRETLTGLGYLG